MGGRPADVQRELGNDVLKAPIFILEQGSGKSLTMTFYAGRPLVQPELENPTLFMLTDRNDLDD